MDDRQDRNSVEEHTMFLNHVVLPRYLPQSKSQHFHGEELTLMSYMVHKVALANIVPPNTIKMLHGLGMHQLLTPDVISGRISALRPGEMFAMLVRSQNCALMVHMPSCGSDRVIVATFPGQLKPKYWANTVSDIQYTYPKQALIVPYTEMVRSTEFAEQLCLLSNELPVETKDLKHYVSNWLVTVLADETSRLPEPQEFPVISKKLRDEVFGEKLSNYFRRSSFYTCVKVFLQESLTIELGLDRGKLLYKLLMLHLLTQIVDYFNGSTCEKLDVELMTQSLAKLARRIEKIADLMQNSTREFVELYKQFDSQAKTTIGNIRRKIDRQIEGLQKDADVSADLSPLTDLDFEADVEQKVPNLLKYLERRKNAIDQKSKSNKLQVTRMQRHYRQNKNAPSLSLLKSISSEIETTLFANDFECWVLYEFSIEENRESPDTLRCWFFDYLSVVNIQNRGDQLSTSRMILTLMKLVAGVDFAACKEHCLLEQHRTCVDPNIINVLLLPQQEDMKIAFELEQYFHKRDSDAKYPGLIEEKSVSQDSFSVKFAAQNNEMQDILAVIREIEQKSVEYKKLEWQNCRHTVESLRTKTVGMECGRWTNWRTVHDRNCQRCRIHKQISEQQIQMYERPLPIKVFEQDAVVFELKCPIEIACLRDILFCFAKFAECPKSFRFKDTICNESEKWISHQQNSQFCTSECKLVFLSGRNSYTFKRHVDDEFDKFILENRVTPTFSCGTFSCGFRSSLSTSKITCEEIKRICTMNVDGNYESLQWTVNGTEHTQNQVISKQGKFPENLSLSEYKNFGSLRADGRRLQLRKLYGMIECEALSFDQSSVLSLVLQLLWEAGVSGTGGAVRESHLDFRDRKFATAMVELLDKYCDQQKNNWETPNKLLMTSLIAVRLFEMNNDEDLAGRIVQLFDKVRTVALDWIDKIAAEITKTSIKSRNKNLHIKLMCASMSGATTFFVNANHEFFEKIFVDNSVTKHSAARVWLQFAISIRNNISVDINNKQLPVNFQLLFRMIRYAGIHIEPTIRLQISNKPHIFDDILLLMKKLWSNMSLATLVEWSFHADQLQILQLEMEIRGSPSFVTVDIVTGEFLVNNMAVDHSPNEITSAKHYKRVFENFVFEVQPDSSSHFSTVQSYNNCSYEFIKMNNETTIIERCDRIESELIPHEILSGEVPHHLVENYSHFWNKTKSTIDFRPKLFTDRNFSNELGIEYRLYLNERRLKHTKTKRYFLDINSTSYKRLTAHLSRLELPKHIHILMERPKIANIELVRMGLKFVVNASVPSERYDMLSNEFVRKRVSLEQKCGTLYGLKHGLLLECIRGESTKLLILPHGKIHTVRRINNSHVSVKISIEEDLCSPPFHQYNVDVFMRQISASSSSCSAWFYLAYLHAVTSHGECEPFLGMSGTERALQILQSGFAWSSEPYDEEATKMLHTIAELSPKRQVMNSTFLQRVEWPSFIPPYSAQDSFVLVAQRLLADSERLIGLHIKPYEGLVLQKPYEGLFLQKPYIKITTATRCNERQYHRNLTMNPNLRICNTFIEKNVMETVSIDRQSAQVSKNTQVISSLYHQQKYFVPPNLHLKNFLLSDQLMELDGPVNTKYIENLLKHQTYKKFTDLWIDLYEYARQGKLNGNQFALIWSVLAHEKNPLAPILALQAVEMNRQAFQSICAPRIEKYVPSEGYEIEEKREYDERLKNDVNDLVAEVERSWPCDAFHLQKHCRRNDIDITKAGEAINRKLLSWNNNGRLDVFISIVENTLKNLPQNDAITTPDIRLSLPAAQENWQRYEIDFKTKTLECLHTHFPNEVREAQMIWKGALEPTTLSKSAKNWWNIYESIVHRKSSQHLIDAGMYPRVVPSLVLPQIASKGDEDLKAIIGALAVTTAHEQRQNRIAIHSQNEYSNRELQNQPYVNWKPCEYPEWILFEIEQNLGIRRIQKEVAKRMIEPENAPNGKHSVMQLNMGEGKTAVITPIVAAVLADGNKVCQITVLKSLFATNLKSLRRYLGGMLNRRVYIFPCRRDMDISKYVSIKIYEECLRMKGVILTVPEYRLSFQLKIYESIFNGKFREATTFLNVHNWINKNVRNVLDESDAILHPKYQLVYTLGKQLPLDGGEIRWIVIQAVLKCVPQHMHNLHNKYGSEKIEFVGIHYQKGVFTPCRILDSTVYDELKSLLIDDFLDGRMNFAFQGIKPAAKTSLRYFLSQKCNVEGSFEKVIEHFSQRERNVFLILSGLLRFEVLKMVMMKRWRVHYGVKNEKEEKGIAEGGRNMAIPFKAKDKAAEMTEFGHSDVALCFTQLSYYYSGLSKNQLDKTFELLSNCRDMVAIYSEWMGSLDSIDPSIATYSGINLSDSDQKKIIYSTYRFNMLVIDFYLSKVVYPREAKVFARKLMCTTWDLCSNMLEHRLTGFSGTNDTKNILPMMVVQNDLKELENTNDNVRRTLLSLENQANASLEANVSGIAILQKLADKNIPVLIDSGALMLELDNEQVAEKWLAISAEQHYDVAVYFDSNDVIQTVDRKGIVSEFEYSVYREKLDKCLVYLDDVHTRGTDLKFPIEWKACVTLSGDITRDKTVQACMRMRQLGRGQSIAFWASYEANMKIQQKCKSTVQHECTPNHHVVEFICDNSQKNEIENTVHWTAGAYNYTKKLMGHWLCSDPHSRSSLSSLLQTCTDDESTELQKMYGDKQEALLSEINNSKFEKLSREFEEHLQLHKFILDVNTKCHAKIVKQAPTVKRFIQELDEEQEKELEMEKEREVQYQIERPHSVCAATPHFDKKLKTLILEGVNYNIMQELTEGKCLMTFLDGLSNTRLIKKYINETMAWSSYMFVTKDFQTTTSEGAIDYVSGFRRLQLKFDDEYLRPVWWVARVEHPTTKNYVLILLSSFECDRLVNAFKKSKFAALYSYRPKLAKGHDNLLHQSGLQISGMANIPLIELRDEVQIAMYSGCMYFATEKEQDAYCNFLGLIPLPRKRTLDNAFHFDLIESNGFVPIAKRSEQAAIEEAVGRCQFEKNPVDLVISLIEAHHCSMPEESHVSSILQKGFKLPINEKR